MNSFDSESERILNNIFVTELLGYLSPEEYDILLLWAVEGYSFKEVGEIIGKKYRNGRILKSSTIQYHLRRATTRIQKLIESSS